MSDSPNVLSAAVSRQETVVTVQSPLPISQGWIVVNPGLSNEERMRIVEVSSNGMSATVEREHPQPHMVASYVLPYTPLTFDRVQTQIGHESDGVNHWSTVPDDLWECGLCGAVVKDQQRHKSWHGAR